jgi:serine protease Do
MSVPHRSLTRPLGALVLAASLGGLAAQPAVAATPAPLVQGLPDFSPLVEAVGPAVVNIRTTQKGSARGAAMTDEQRELFRRFFGVPAPRGEGPKGGDDDTPEVRRGVGSGFILSADGVVLTNAHVVEGADKVYVRLTDDREFEAKVLGADARSDVAVVKITATGLPTVRFGDSDKLKVGEWVIAIGSPFNLDNTVTAGIVSAKARDTGDLLPLIQTDVAINPGNSGGPLINMRGEVVGINSQIYSRSGGYQGIAFAIPGDEVQRIASELRTNGRVVRGRIGVRIGEVTTEVAESLGLPKAAGALVRGTEDDGPGAKAGVEPGDIITRLDERPIAKWTDLPRFVASTRPGTEHKLTVLRQGAQKELRITIAEQPPEKTVAQADTPKPEAAPTGRAAALGLKLAELTEAEKRELKLQRGVRIEAATGAAARADLRAGDLLLNLSNRDVTGLAQLETLLEKVDPAKPFSVLIRREEFVQYAVIRPQR